MMLTKVKILSKINKLSIFNTFLIMNANNASYSKFMSIQYFLDTSQIDIACKNCISQTYQDLGKKVLQICVL